MAIALDTSKNVAASGGITSNTNYTCTGANLIMFVAIERDPGDSVTGITYNSAALTQINTQNLNTGNTVELWYLIAPATGLHTLAVTMTGIHGADGWAATYTGAKQTGQPDASSVGGPTTTASYSQNVTSIADNCWGVMVLGFSSTIPTAGTNTTIRGSFNGSSASYVDSNGPLTPAGTLTLAFTSVSQIYAGVMASFAPAPASGSIDSLGHTISQPLNHNFIQIVSV